MQNPEQNRPDPQLQKKRRRELMAYFKEIAGKEGLGGALRRTARYFKRRYGGKKGRFLPPEAALARQRAADTAAWPLISICVPVYNPDPGFFAELLDSVQAQTCPRWQLCLADASDDPAAVAAAVEKRGDERICLVRVANAGIAANTNAAAALATGEYLAFADHDDRLSPDAVYEFGRAILAGGAGFLYSDEALFAKDWMRPSVAHCKPDYAPQYLLCCNYIAHMAVVRRDIFDAVGALRSECDGSQDHDLYLRVAEVTGGAVHIPRVLYYWRQHAGSTSTGVAAKPYVAAAAKKAIDDHLARTGVAGRAVDGRFGSTYKVAYEIVGSPLVSIVIPSHEHPEELRTCVESIYAKSTWGNFEVVVVENGSRQPDTFACYEKLQAAYPTLRVVTAPAGPFNFSAICNLGRAAAGGEYVLLLNNDVEVIAADWLEQMLQLCQLQNVGIVGALLYYPDDTVQHAGVITGLGGYAGHSHKYARRGGSGYMFRLACVQELSAVTGACMMVKADVYDSLGGLDESFAVAYNDVDFCLRARAAGQWVLFTPYAELYHYESKSRGSDEAGPAKERFEGEKRRLADRWGAALLHDPFYSPGLTLDREDFSENEVQPGCR